jgi:hypothetical protein
MTNATLRRGVNMSMTPDPYGKAYEKALEDLTSISDRFTQLCARKKLVENAIAALQPVLVSSQPAEKKENAIVAQEFTHSSTEDPAAVDVQAEPASSYSFLAVPSPLPESDGDPFQRRVRSNFHFRELSAQRSA